ncbi:MAG TPA: CDF family Co(II)/Ni(II) efflux transporter DmeF [Caulobacteraceae bacterium]|jgi:cation diffusion facilitator family transporter|nr:CDF family Co(II)/Ni(II) efflux transporter DmeF [Caulobacteraceae bacterium]
MTAVEVKAARDPAGARICGSGGFLGAQHARNERRTWIVVGVTAAMMVGEIAGGAIYGSMALLADGWHMSTHAAAMTVAALAYRYAWVHANDPRFAFGTGKVGELAGFASAVVLGVIALIIGVESFARLLSPQPIHFSQATAIAVLGLGVNLVSAWLLHQGDHHDHGHAAHDHAAADQDDHDHEPERDALHPASHHHDNNLRAAYQHVLADALTSVLAIAGLLAGRYLGWVWMDPVIGVVGALVIAQWSWGLMRSAGASLLDMSASSTLANAVRERLESASDTVSDLHLWRLGPGHQGLIVSLVSTAPLSPEAYKARLTNLPGLSHVTVEVNPPGV